MTDEKPIKVEVIDGEPGPENDGDGHNREPSLFWIYQQALTPVDGHAVLLMGPSMETEPEAVTAWNEMARALNMPQVVDLPGSYVSANKTLLARVEKAKADSAMHRKDADGRLERVNELLSENLNLRQELHEPDSPEGKVYQSELTRAEKRLAEMTEHWRVMKENFIGAQEAAEKAEASSRDLRQIANSAQARAEKAEANACVTTPTHMMACPYVSRERGTIAAIQKEDSPGQAAMDRAFSAEESNQDLRRIAEAAQARADRAEAERDVALAERHATVDQLDELREVLYPLSDGHEARVDTVRRIASERDEARAENEKLQRHLASEKDKNIVDSELAYDAHANLTAENEKLRSALEDIANGNVSPAISFARAALDATKEEVTP